MSLNDLIESDLELIFSVDEFAAAGTYTPAGGDEVPISAIVTYGEDLDDAQWRAALQASAVVHVRESEIVIVTHRLTHGEVTDGPFAAGDTVTGGESGSTAEISTVETGSIVVAHLSGSGFVAGETITSGTKSAEISEVEEIETRANPTYQDTIVLDGIEWTVARRVSRSAGVWKLELRRDLRPTFRK